MRELLTGLTSSLLLLLNTLILIGPMMLIALLKLVLPGQRLKDLCSRGVMWIAETWAEIDKWIFATTPTVWDVRGAGDLRQDTSYLVVSNHQSWVDIPALIQVFNRRTPYFKFFLKKELIWVPFLGLAWWALEYPFMKRYSKAFLEKHPELKGKDLEITRAACEVQAHPGDRGELPGRHAFQRAEEGPATVALSPPAQAQGRRVAFVLAALGEQLDALLDVTVVYPSDKVPGFWDLLCGRVPKVIVDIQTRPIDPALWQGDYENDPVFRQYVQEWVSRMWEERTNASPACGNCAEVPAEAHPSRRANNRNAVIRRFHGAAADNAGALFALPVRATNTRGRTHS